MANADASLAAILQKLNDDRPAVSDEIQVLQAIFGNEKVKVLEPRDPWRPGQPLRLVIEAELVDSDVDASFVVSLGPTYPDSSPPQIQLSGKYLGEFGIDSQLFGQITRIYHAPGSGQDDGDGIWHAGEVAIFEGIERAKEICEAFIQDKRNELVAKEAANPHATQNDSELARELQYEQQERDADPSLLGQQMVTSSGAHAAGQPNGSAVQKLPSYCKIFTSDAIVDRKSVFIGHACSLEDPEDVSKVVAHLLSDKKIAKAAHPAMLAYRCRAQNGVLYQDNDDDGETAAGSRLAHLLQILDIENVLVVVTRWFGGVHLGADRFKHINQAARDALVQGGFIKANHGKK